MKVLVLCNGKARGVRERDGKGTDKRVGSLIDLGVESLRVVHRPSLRPPNLHLTGEDTKVLKSAIDLGIEGLVRLGEGRLHRVLCLRLRLLQPPPQGDCLALRRRRPPLCRRLFRLQGEQARLRLRAGTLGFA
jgi:hypothetical protein